MALLHQMYRVLTFCVRPFLPVYLHQRAHKGKEVKARLLERYGCASRARPVGKVIWVHGASVGETLSALPLLRRLKDLNPEITLLVTSGTVTSAQLLDKQLPEGAIHQFVPLDTTAYAKRFLDHWQPDAVLWIESDLWPILLGEVKRRSLPACLLNARMTARSARRWQHPVLRGWVKDILSTFALVLAQSRDMAQRFTELGASTVHLAGNLKFTAPVLPANAGILDGLQVAMGDRPRWLMASTHAGEEAIALAVHSKLKERWPTLLTLIVPRHPVRAPDILALMKDCKVAQRSQNQRIEPGTDIYLADTMGELGIFYRAAPIACVGASFTPKGGHNPIEPAQCGCAVLCGPDMSNITDIAEALSEAGVLTRCQTSDDLAQAVAALLEDPARLERIRQLALDSTAHPDAVLTAILTELSPHLAQAGVRCL